MAKLDKRTKEEEGTGEMIVTNMSVKPIQEIFPIQENFPKKKKITPDQISDVTKALKQEEPTATRQKLLNFLQNLPE